MIEFESSSLKTSNEHVDVVESVSLKLDAKKIGILLKSRKRPVANLALGGKPGGQQRVAERYQRGAAPPVPRPSLTRSSRRLLWRGRSTLVTAAQRAVLCEDRTALSSPRVPCRRPRGGRLQRGNDPAFSSLPGRGASVFLEANAAGDADIWRSALQRRRRRGGACPPLLHCSISTKSLVDRRLHERAPNR